MSSTASTINLSIEGMSCGGCARSITNGLKTIEGVQNVEIDLAGKKGVVDCDATSDVDTMKKTVQDKIIQLGFTSEFL